METRWLSVLRRLKLDKVHLFKVHPYRWATYGFIVLAAIGSIILMNYNNEDEVPDAAVAALAAALIGILGTNLGHVVGGEHKKEKPPKTYFKPGKYQDGVFVGLVVAALLGAGYLLLEHNRASEWLGLTDEAKAALIAALIGIPVTDLAHEVLLRSTPNYVLRVAGPLIISLSIVVGGLLLWFHPWGNASQVNAEGFAAFAAAGAGIGGTFIAHHKAISSGNSSEPAAAGTSTTPSAEASSGHSSSG